MYIPPAEEVFIQHILVILDSEQPAFNCDVCRLNDNLLISIGCHSIRSASCAVFKLFLKMPRPHARNLMDHGFNFNIVLYTLVRRRYLFVLLDATSMKTMLEACLSDDHQTRMHIVMSIFRTAYT